MKKILVVEDDLTLLEVLQYNLCKQGYKVILATDGVKAVEAARQEKPDLIILDVMLPQMDGFEVCRLLRREMPTPILMLTAKVEEIDKVIGLELGADDYVTKPFSMRELLARVRAMLRRSEMVPQELPAAEKTFPPSLKAGELEIDLARHRVTRRGVVVNLSPKEFELLAFLMRHRGWVFTREQLLEKVWGYDYEGDTRTVDVHIRWLREKIEVDPSHPRYLVTLRGVGYKFEDEDAP
jgi:two-component system OmpR family response regulator